MLDKHEPSDIKPFVANIVAAYVSNHTVKPEDLPGFMQLVRYSLHSINSNQSLLTAPTNPAIAIEESIAPDYIVCLEDGRQMKMLKRHLKAVYNMTPDQYRERWALPANYPMVASNYAKQRSTMAKSVGLGKQAKSQKKAVA